MKVEILAEKATEVAGYETLNHREQIIAKKYFVAGACLDGSKSVIAEAKAELEEKDEEADVHVDKETKKAGRPAKTK
jgi:hypothetical protein